MTKIGTKTTWKCDACDKVVTHDEAYEPQGWGYVTLKFGHGYGCTEKMFQTCDDCRGKKAKQLLPERTFWNRIRRTFKKLFERTT